MFRKKGQGPRPLCHPSGPPIDTEQLRRFYKEGLDPDQRAYPKRCAAPPTRSPLGDQKRASTTSTVRTCTSKPWWIEQDEEDRAADDGDDGPLLPEYDPRPTCNGTGCLLQSRRTL